jgi:hypothetical protein
MGMEAGTQNDNFDDNLDEEIDGLLNDGEGLDEDSENNDTDTGNEDDLFLSDNDSDSEGDSDLDDEEDQEDDDDSDSDDDSEGDSEDTDTDDSESAEDDPTKKTDEEKADASSELVPLDEEVKARIKPDYVPGSKEFFQATAAEAKAAVKNELGDFDEFDPDHIARYNYYVAEAQARRKSEYQKGVEQIKDERKAKEVVGNLDSQMQKILPTPELKKKFGQALKQVSHGTYMEIEEALMKGDTSKLIDLAKKVAGPHGQLLDGKKPAGSRKAGKAPVKNKGELYGSDILGF